jgi:thioredoxin-related protein
MSIRFLLFRRAVALFALVFSASAGAALFSSEASDIRAELEAARGEGRRLAIFFELPDCPRCLEMKRRVFADPDVERQFGRDYRAVRIDLAAATPVADEQGAARTARELAERWRIYGAPSFVFFAADGSLEYRFAGSLADPADFLRLGRFVFQADYENRPFSDYLHSSHGHRSDSP